MPDSSDDRKPLSSIELEAQVRKAARAREIAENEKLGHRDDSGISPFDVPLPRKVEFDPNY